jgi:hypothetical protein
MATVGFRTTPLARRRHLRGDQEGPFSVPNRKIDFDLIKRKEIAVLR